MEGGEKTTVDASQNETEQLYDCKWSSCEGKHKKQITYPDNGKYQKGSTYRTDWIKEGMQPWNPKTYGPGRQLLLPNGTVDPAATAEYETQAHHLVPTTLLKKLATLKDNLKLVSYDCDARENGMMLPKSVDDIPRHQLQAHSGPHPSDYMDPILKELERIQQDADGICNGDIEGTMALQKTVPFAVVDLSALAKAKILAIGTEKDYWPVRTNALQEYKDAMNEYARRGRLRAEKMRTTTHLKPGGNS